MDKSTHQIRREHWAKIINDCLASGMNKTAWCKENGISDKSFFYWQRILRKDACLEQKQVPDVVKTQNESSVAFVELKPTINNSTNTPVFRPDVIIHSGSISLEVSNTASPELLQSLRGLFYVE